MLSASSVRPGVVYVATTDSRHGQVKIGRSQRSDLRIRQGRTWVGDIEVKEQVAFLDCVSAERAAHGKFSTKRLDGEWFAVSPDSVRRYLDSFKASEALAMTQFNEAVQKAAGLGLLSAEPASRPDSLLNELLSWTVPRTKTCLAELTAQALSRHPSSLPAAAALEAHGFIVSRADSVVLLDLASDSPLPARLNKLFGPQRWHRSIYAIAGFDAMAQPVKMETWLRASVAAPGLKTRLQLDRRRLDA